MYHWCLVLYFPQYRANCGTYYRCVPAPAGKRSVASALCQSELFFDVEQQICERKYKVDNCAQIDSE